MGLLLGLVLGAVGTGALAVHVLDALMGHPPSRMLRIIGGILRRMAR